MHNALTTANVISARLKLETFKPRSFAACRIGYKSYKMAARLAIGVQCVQPITDRPRVSALAPVTGQPPWCRRRRRGLPFSAFRPRPLGGIGDRWFLLRNCNSLWPFQFAR